MSTIQIADKPTLDTVKTTVDSTATTISTVSTDVTTIKNDVSALKAQGGFKSDGTDFYAYNPANSSWNKVSFGGGGGSPTLTILNEDMNMTGWTITVTHESGEFTTTETMPNEASLEVEVPYLGEYEIEYYQSGMLKGWTAIKIISKNNYLAGIDIKFGAFATSSWKDIAGMCDAYYNGKIADLTQYWSVGDTKSVDLSAMSATTGVNESYAAQTVQFAIIDFAHDNLTTSISGKTKAAITIQQVDSLKETGYMNSTNTNVGGWTNSARRAWCNDIYFGALPSEMKSVIKPVNKLTTSGGNYSTIINTDSDKIFLPSEVEICNSHSYSQAGEGAQYTYYQTAANRIKKVNGSANVWWLRSPYLGNSNYFVYVDSTGSVYYSGANGGRGLAPALCI